MGYQGPWGAMYQQPYQVPQQPAYQQPYAQQPGLAKVDGAAEALGRPVCVRGLCYGRADR